MSLIFGSWTIGGWHWSQVNREESVRAVKAAVELGFNEFDTAPVYGFGLSEEILGQALKRTECKIYTKCGLNWEGSGHFFFRTVFKNRDFSVSRDLHPDRIFSECNSSLKRLNRDVIDLYQIHWTEPGRDILETADVMLELIRQGKIRNWGVCNINTGELTRLIESGKKPYSLQFKYSPLARKAEKSVIPVCRKHGIHFMAYSVLEQGLLSGALNNERELCEDDGRKWIKSDRKKLVRELSAGLEVMCKKYDTDVAPLILAWALAQKGVTDVLAGMRNLMQVESNASALNLELEVDDIHWMNEWFNR